MADKEQVADAIKKVGSAVKDHVSENPGRLAAGGAMIYALKKYNDAKKKKDQFGKSEYSDMANTSSEMYSIK